MAKIEGRKKAILQPLDEVEQNSRSTRKDSKTPTQTSISY
jgi:hypothetical protein